MRDGKLWRALHGIGVVDHGFQQGSGRGRQILDVVSLRFHLLHDAMNGAENIEIGRGANVALVGWEAEHRDRQLLVDTGFDAQR